MDTLNTTLAELAKKLGLSIEHLWPHAVRSTMLTAIFEVIVGIGCGFLTYILFKLMLKAANKTEEASSWNELEWGMASVLLVCLTVAAGIATIINLHSITIIIEPEGWLVRSLLK